MVKISSTTTEDFAWKFASFYGEARESVWEREDKTSLFERERELKGLVMDIRLKPDYHSTFLSSIDAAAGTDKRYYGRALGLKINDFHRWSVFAGANNTNHNEELTP